MAESESDREPRAVRPGTLVIAAGQLLGLVLALVLLLWGADALARIGAQTLVARNLAQATGVVDLSAVEVGGRLFVPQVIRGSYDEVAVGITGVTSGPLRIDRIEARLAGVRVPFHDVLVRDVGDLGVVDSASRVRLTYADLNSYFAQTGRPLQISSESTGGRLRIAGTVDVLGQRIDAGAVVAVSAAGGTLRITPVRIDTGDAALSAASRLLLQERLALTIPLGSLPFGQDVVSVASTADALIVETVGYGVVVGG